MSTHRFSKYLTTALILISNLAGYCQSASITVNVSEKGARISPLQYGIFYEEIQHAGDGGLYAEMIENRSFEGFRNGADFESRIDRGLMPVMDDPANMRGWELRGNGRMVLDQSEPLNDNNPTALKVECKGNVSVVNAGFLPDAQKEGLGVGISCRKNEPLLLSLYARDNPQFNGELTAELETKEGTVLSKATFKGITKNWRKFKAELLPKKTCVSARLVLKANSSGVFWLDMVSLFPKDTFNGRPNGLRKDIAEMLKALKPSFVRFPGGCFTEGLYQLKEAWNPLKTLGSVAQRPGLPGARWQYGSTDGLGYYELLQMCEDLDAKPLLVINPGMSHGDEAIIRYDDPNAQFPHFLHRALSALQFANGETDTKWGAMRASMGHPRPFDLNYVEIGNEDGDFPSYHERYEIFRSRLLAKYPGLHIVADAPLSNDSLRRRYNDDPTMRILDEHYYTSVGWSIDNFHKYDSYNRKGPKIYVGEFGVTNDPSLDGGKRLNNLKTALGEAVFWLGCERNSDVVIMTSYAPLLCRLDDKMWPSNLIYFDQARVFGSPSYYVIKMLSNNRGDVNLAVKSKSGPVIIKTETPGQNKFSDDRFRHSIYAGATLSEKNGEVIIKVVNFASVPQPTSIYLEGIRKIDGSCSFESLADRDITAANSFEHPLNVAPVTERVNGSGRELKCRLKANSFTIIRIPVEKEKMK